jgi:carbon monoxide dehydrogenase subunit G
MPIRYEHTIHVARPPERVFALIDDVGQTPRWLARCTGIEKLDPGENHVGTRLRYAYKDGGRTGVMDGSITERKPNERLTLHYQDKMMAVVVDFRLAPGGDGTELTNAFEITPRTFLAKLFSPFIRHGLPTQTLTAMTAMKKLLEG